jgi:hypothetical protein
MKKNILFFILLLNSIAIYAQEVTGNNPSNIQWKYIETKAVKVIFPAGNEKEGLRIANAINYISDSAGVTVGMNRKHLDMLIQTQQVISNGYVSLAPYRSELYATALQNFNLLGSMSWLDVLTLHEYRHALQYANTRRGLTKFAYIIGGERGWQLVQNLSVPNWYFEGDAVQTETVLSLSGRGRTPFFFQEQKALLFNNRNYKYIKARNGSFKDLMPDHYRLGYAMLQYGRNEFGPDTWKTVLAGGGSYRSIIYPFSRALKKQTGYTTRKMYYKAYDQLKEQWEKELSEINLIPTKEISKPNHKTVTSYAWAHELNDSSIIAIKSSFKKIDHLVQIKNGEEKRLFTIGNITESFMSHNNNKLAWSEMSTDIRRQNKNFNDIFTYDLNTHKKKRLTKKTKLFAPQFSAKGDLIVAVKADENIKNRIVFLNGETGQEVDSIANPNNDFISYPKWSRDDKSIIYLAKQNSQVAMFKYDIANKATVQLTPWSAHVIEGISIGENNVYFTASYSGINNLYATNLNGDQSIKQISSVKIGANMPSISQDEKTIYMSEFNYLGQRLTSQSVNLDSAKAISIIEPIDLKTFNVVTTNVESSIIDKIPTQTYEIKDYKGAIRGPKLHTWGVVSDLSSLGISFQVNNILNDFGLGINGGYNRNEGTYNASANIDYAKWFLPISLNAALNDRSTLAYANPVPTENDTTMTVKFRETIVGANLALPLAWLHGAYKTSFKLVGGASQISTFGYEANKKSVDTSFNFSILQAGLAFTNLRKMAHQNLLPRFGQELGGTISQSINDESVIKYSAQATLYLPGILANHSLALKGAWVHEQLSNNYRFLDNFNHARGYTPILGDEEYVASINYQLPLLYPDFGFGGLAYLKRVRVNLFADFSEVQRYAVNKSYSQNSTGFELLFDVVFANMLPITVGARNSFLLNDDYYDKSKTSKFQFYFAGTF